MDTPYNTWLCASLFYNNAEFDKLIYSGLMPLINSLEDQEMIKGFLCSLNSVQGNNLRLSVLLHDDKKEEALDRFHFVVNRFFEDYPSVNKQIGYPLKGFLRPFPNNSVQYNLYNNPLATSADVMNFRMDYSQFMFDFFSANAADEETVIFFLLCSVLYMMQVVAERSDTFRCEVMKPVDDWAVPGEDRRMLYDHFFQENKDLLLETYRAVARDDAGSEVFKSVVETKKSFRRFVMDGHNLDLDAGSVISSLNSLMLSQLDLGAEDSHAIYYIIGQCMKYKGPFL